MDTPNYLTPLQGRVIARILQRANRQGFLLDHHVCGPSRLPRWKRWWNRYLGIRWVDPGNWRRMVRQSLSEMEVETVGEVLVMLLPPPSCKYCGSTRLEADPAGSYCDAEGYWGEPLVCLDSEKAFHRPVLVRRPCS